MFTLYTNLSIVDEDIKILPLSEADQKIINDISKAVKITRKIANVLYIIHDTNIRLRITDKDIFLKFYNELKDIINTFIDPHRSLLVVSPSTIGIVDNQYTNLGFELRDNLLIYRNDILFQDKK